MDIGSIVNVNITRSTTAVAQQDLSIINILSTDCNFQDLIRSYTDLAGLAADLVGGVGSMTYRIAQQVLAQSPRVTKFMVSHWGSKRAICMDGGTMTAGTITITINGTTYSQAFTGGSKAATLTAISNTLGAVSGITVSSIAYVSGGLILNITRTTTGPLYVTIAATGLGGSDTMKVGLIQQGTIVDNGGTYTAGSLVTTINGTPFTTAYDNDKSDTLADLGAALVTNSSGCVSWANSSGTTITWYGAIGKTVAIAVDDSAITGTMAVGEVAFTAQTVSDTLDSILLINNGWYGLLATTGVDPITAVLTNQKAIADWAETNSRFYGCGSSDLTIINTAKASDTTSMAYYVQSKSYTHTSVFYSSTAHKSFPAASLLGKIMPLTPGSYNTKFLTLAGVVADGLTSTQYTNATAKNAMVYTPVGSNNITAEGKVGSGEWIDIIIGIDWQMGLIKTYVFSALKNNLKVPYDDRGISIVGAGISQALEQGIASGLYTAHLKDADGTVSGGYVITLPKASAISLADKAARTLNNVTFVAYLAGAINALTINGTVTY